MVKCIWILVSFSGQAFISFFDVLFKLIFPFSLNSILGLNFMGFFMCMAVPVEVH